MLGPPNAYRKRQVSEIANGLFERSWRTGQLKRLWARLTGQSRQPPLLGDVRRQHPNITVHELGDHPVRIENIIGTEGKLSYDRDFHPLQRRSKGRWVSVAETMMTDPTSLPPIDVVQVGDDFYVRDGTHRVSVARALGHIYIDGNITKWAFENEENAASSPSDEG